ncbi:cupredoxin domain-containing protein [Streptomyces tubercidicus]|uniref:cupredoxin domain-containing protein n=1 Tax=Streptomyces tubercidicus TaxID=47759 RepID=UPI003465725B
MPKRRDIVAASWTVLVATVSLLATGCLEQPAGESAPPYAGPTAGPTGLSATGTAKKGTDGVQRITVTVDDRQRFFPSHIRARPGALVITVRNTGGTPHTLTLQGRAEHAGSGMDNLNGGRRGSIRLTFTGPGRYAFFCAYHAGVGMEGEILVR